MGFITGRVFIFIFTRGYRNERDVVGGNGPPSSGIGSSLF
jgi:hypothetical protein